MKKSNILFALSFLLVTFFYFSCSKERIQTQLSTYSPVNTYLDSKKQAEQDFVINNNGPGPIVGNQGTKLYGPGKQCLMLPNGDTISWPYTIKLVELYKPKDMIYYQMPTISAGTILKTDGEIRLRAFQGTTELVLKPGCPVPIEMPCAAPQSGMHVFNGITTSGHPDWVDNSPVNLFTVNAAGDSASITKLGWINCGQLAGSTSNSTLTFVSTTDDLTNVGIFIYIPGTKTVMQVYNSASGAIPNGSSVKIVAIGLSSNGNLFTFYQNQTVNSSSQVSITLTGTTDAALTTVLDGL
jgi:hypothetical protein